MQRQAQAIQDSLSSVGYEGPVEANSMAVTNRKVLILHRPLEPAFSFHRHAVFLVPDGTFYSKEAIFQSARLG